jgi:hypothetical protein
MTDQTMTKIPPYTVIRLGLEHLDQLMDLQDRVLSRLSGQTDVVFPKTKDFFSHLITHDKHYMLGVMSADGILVEKSAVILPHKEEPDTYLYDMNWSAPIETVSNLAGSMSDPNVRGHGLMMMAARQWMKDMKDAGRKHAVATMNADNVSCWNPFLREGFQIVSASDTMVTRINAYMIHRDLSKPTPCDCLHVRGDFSKAAKAGTPVEIVTPQTPFAKLKDLFNQGYVGVSPERDANNKYTGNIVFVPEQSIICHGQPKLCAP